MREDNWRETLERAPEFVISESPTYVARGVAAFVVDGEAPRWSGQIVASRQLADAYDVTDTGYGLGIVGAPTRRTSRAAVSG